MRNKVSICACLCAALIFYPAFALAQSRAGNSGNRIENSFPEEELLSLGSYYYPEQWDESQWERDLKKMASMGIAFTHFAEFAWAALEPEEGRYDFRWLDKAVALADSYGLKVILCTPSPCPPVWLSEKHPEILIRRDNGVGIRHSRRQHASWSSACYREYVGKIVTALAERYGDNPAVIGWQIDNEPGHYGVVDYSENAQAAFRLFLKEKYGSIEALNKSWGCAFWSETYQNFDQIRMPNQQEVPEKPNPHAMLDMYRFNASELASFVNFQADVLRSHISDRQWITTNLIPVSSAVDPFLADHLDFTTYTRYLVTGHRDGVGEQGFRLGDPEYLGFSNDQFRNFTGGTYGVMELQPGQVNWGTFNPQPMPGAVRMWVWHVFAGGGRFVCNYRFRQPLRGSEQYHYGMLMPDGLTLSPGGEEYMQVAKEMKKLRKSLDRDAAEPAERAARRTGLMYEMSNHWEMENQKQTPQWKTLAHAQKYHNILKKMSCPVDVIGENADFSRFPFLLAPAYQLLDSALVDRWTEYVRGGGHLVLSCRSGQKDRNGALWQELPSAPIYELCGIKGLFYDLLPQNYYGTIALDGKEYKWNNWADVLTPCRGTEVWASYSDQFYAGKAAVTHRRLGKGSVTFVAADSDDGALEEAVLRRLYAEAGVEVENLPYGVIKEWRDGFYIALNYSSQTQSLDRPSDAEVLLGGAEIAPAGVTVWKR